MWTHRIYGWSAESTAQAARHVYAFYLPVCLVAFALALTPGAAAQSPVFDSEQPEADYGYGAQVLLTNSGFGLGGYLAQRLATNWWMLTEASLSQIRDEREVAFFDRFGQRDVPSKANYLVALPIHVGFQKRLFRSRIENNFRPFLHASVGPTIGWKYPYFDDENDNGTLDGDERTYDVLSGLRRGDFEPGLGGSVSLGADFGPLTGTSYGVRIGYRFTRFRNPIELIEASIKPPERFIGSPVLMVYFGSLKPGS